MNTKERLYLPLIESVTSCISAIFPFGAAQRGEGDVAGEEKLVGVPKFHSWSKCTMPNKHQSDWMSNVPTYLLIYMNPLTL